MSVINRTPYPAISFKQYNKFGGMNGVVAVRGTFVIPERGPLLPAATQAPLVMADTYAGDPQTSAFTAQSDLVPFKPGTDITFQGSSYAPGGKPAVTWLCGLKVGPMEKTLRVHGPRLWAPTAAAAADDDHDATNGTWAFSDATPISSLPLEWRHAYGGMVQIKDSETPEPYTWNPLGRGVFVESDLRADKPVPAPQLEAPHEPIIDRRIRYVPRSMGPVPPFWRQRLRYAGTYDENWKKNRHPLLPEDFDYRFYQCASEDMVVTPWLTGTEAIEMVHLHPKHAHPHSALPGLTFVARVRGKTVNLAVPLKLDGVHFDFRPDVNRVFLTWRGAFPAEKGQSVPELHGGKITETATATQEVGHAL